MIRKMTLTTLMVSMLFILELLLMKRMGIRIVWTVHNLLSHERIHPRIEKTMHQVLLGVFDEIIHLSQASIPLMHGMYRVSTRIGAKFHVVPHGHYIHWYKNSISRAAARTILEIDKDAKVLLCFGVIRPYKGIDVLLDAVRDMPEQNLRVLIAGRAKHKGLEDRLRLYCRKDPRIEAFLHFIPDYDVQIFMNAADIVVLPYSDILNSGATILAMSFGKPVIAPDTGSIPELIDGHGGVLFDPNNKESLSQAIRRSLSLDLQAMGRSNLEKISRLDWGAIASMTADVYAGKKERCQPQ
jgi:glycosyltransferase involved in cell wall biosynthesis